MFPLRMVGTKDLHNCCWPGRVWWPGMGWPDIRGLNEANRSREQQLLIGELFREEISPSCPSFCSCNALPGVGLALGRHLARLLRGKGPRRPTRQSLGALRAAQLQVVFQCSFVWIQSRSLSGRHVSTGFLDPVFGPWWIRFVGIRGAPRLTEACPRHAWQELLWKKPPLRTSTCGRHYPLWPFMGT